MRALTIQKGQRFHRWTILKEVARRKAHRQFRCRCDCGTVKVIGLRPLVSEGSQSCGCLRKELQTKHGMWKSVEYNLWAKMIWRCSPRARKQERRNYFKRGITVCAEWKQSFALFYQHVGPRPSPQYSLDRIDNDKGYEPGNVRWATRSQQRANKRCSIWERALLLVCRHGGIEPESIRGMVEDGDSDVELAQHIAKVFKPVLETANT